MLLQVHYLHLMVECVLVNLSSLLVLILESFLEDSVIILFFMPIFNYSFEISFLLIYLLHLLLNQLSICLVHISQPLHPNLLFELFLLLLPLLVPLFISLLNLIKLVLLGHLTLQHMINVLVHPPLHVIFEVFEESPVLLLPLHLFLSVELAQLLPLLSILLK